MGQTVIEKILSRRSRDAVRAGEVIWMDLDVRSARDFGGPNVVRHFEREYGEAPVADPEKTFFTFDLCVPACSIRYADNQQVCREFAKKKGFRVFDVDAGIGSHVLIEEGLAVSGGTVVGTDSHLNILGAVGCFGQGMGDVDITFAFKSGRTWFEVPESVRVYLTGMPSPGIDAKDLTLAVIRELGTTAGALRSIEFFGEPVKRLGLAGRITLCSMVTEMAGIVGFVPEMSEAFAADYRALTGKDLSPLMPDVDAVYADEITVDVDGLTPLVAAPFLPTNVKSIDDLKGTPIHSGFIGSCTNGRAEDFAAAARILDGRKLKDGIMLKMVPATRRVYEDILRNGVLGSLFRSGAVISNPGCGGCAEGHIGLTGKGEVQVSTGNRNFAGKQGKGEIYLTGPAVVAASCLAGEITGPEDV
ncbi:MAG: aconitase/3-isopropylmalate dehydratase large subunit family protein [Candidatus Aminicenantes bacterium]|nr:aconitase/3-isopropylmalate dehydratase large subunit family protein [Candidatus Aminicenantes bacterium]